MSAHNEAIAYGCLAAVIVVFVVALAIVAFISTREQRKEMAKKRAQKYRTR